MQYIFIFYSHAARTETTYKHTLAYKHRPFCVVCGSIDGRKGANPRPSANLRFANWPLPISEI